MNKQIKNLIDKIHAQGAFLSFELTPPLSADTSEFIAKIKNALSQTTQNQNLDSKNAIESSADFGVKNIADSSVAGQNLHCKSTAHQRLDSQKMPRATLGEAIDAFVCTDSPLARFKPSSILSSIKLQNALDKPLICTLSMRDRNSIALCGEILAANEFDLRAFLTLTGDPIKLGDCAESKGVFEENSLKLGRIIAELNAGVAINGKPLITRLSEIFAFSTINSYANNPASLKTKLKRKLLNSQICAFFTQPIFAKQSAEFLLEALEGAKCEIINDSNQWCKRASSQHLTQESSQNLTQERAQTIANANQNTQIIFGFFPVLSYRVAVFLRDKLPGVYIPQMWLEKLESASAKSKDYEREVGLELSRKVWEDLQALHPKIHFMSSNNIALLGEFV